MREIMSRGPKSQLPVTGTPGAAPVMRELIIPNPKLKLLDQVREVMRLRHYSIRTEQCHCDWNPASPVRLRLCAFALISLLVHVAMVRRQDRFHRDLIQARPKSVDHDVNHAETFADEEPLYKLSGPNANPRYAAVVA